MEDPKPLKSVTEFHELFNLPVLKKSQIPSKERCELRINLLQEELNELKEAIENNDLVEAADAFADLQYVLSGAILEFGMQGVFKNLFDEVHRSNMSKACSSLEEAKETQKFYKENKDTDSEIVQKEDKFLVYRVGDKKVLKSVGYSPANLKKLIHEHL